MKKTLILPLVFLTLTTPVIAQEAPVDEMFRVMSIDKQMTGGFEAMLPVIDQMTLRFGLDDEGKAELKEVFRTWFNEDIDRQKITEELRILYSSAFTDNEIKAITKFYKSSVGQKLLNKTPQLMKTGAQIGMQEAQSKQAKLMARVKEFMERRGIQQ